MREDSVKSFCNPPLACASWSLPACLQQCDSISPAISGTGSNQRGIEPSLLGSFIPKYWSVTLQNIYIMGRENMEQEKRVDMGMGCGGGEHAFI